MNNDDSEILLTDNSNSEVQIISDNKISNNLNHISELP